MTFLSFAEKIKLESKDFIMLYYGRDELEKNFFAYIICDKNGLIKLRADYGARKNAELASYGKIIYFEFVAEPDETAEEFLKDFVENYKYLKDLL